MRTASPESVGVDSRRLDRISRTMQDFVDTDRLPGAAVLVARRGEVIYAESFGWMNIESKQPMRLDTIFPIYSVTKPVTAVAAMMLYEEGRFQLYDPISKFIPEFREMQVCKQVSEEGMELVKWEGEITIRQLLTHTAGLPSRYWAPPPLQRLLAQELRPDRTVGELARGLAGVPLWPLPGVAWRYSDGYEVLACIVELLSGMSFESFLRQRLFDPLNMDETGYSVPKGQRDRVASFYNVSETGEFVEAVEATPYTLHPTMPRGGFGLYSTVLDHLRFAQMLLNGGELDGRRVLARKTVQLMTQNHLPDQMMPIEVIPGFFFRGHGYGLGFRVLTDLVASEIMGSRGEYGWYGIGGNYFWNDPQEELIGIIMMRVDALGYMRIDPSLSFFSVINPFRTLVYQALVD